MTAEIFNQADFVALTNRGVVSLQLLSPLNSAEAPFTITRVNVEHGAVQPRHQHETAEQVWIALSGSGVLLLEGGETRPFTEDQVARSPPVPLTASRTPARGLSSTCR